MTVNSITNAMQTESANLYQERSLSLQTIHAEATTINGGIEPHIARSPIPRVPKVFDQTEVQRIIALVFVVMGSGSGCSCWCFRSVSPRWLGIGIIAGADWPLGMCSFFSRVLRGSGTQLICLVSTIRLPGGDGGYRYSNDSGIVATLASVPWFLVGLAGIAWGWVSSNVESLGDNFRSRRGYRNIPVDEDAQILRFEDEEQ